jgi:hypothetical protein
MRDGIFAVAIEPKGGDVFGGKTKKEEKLGFWGETCGLFIDFSHQFFLYYLYRILENGQQ